MSVSTHFVERFPSSLGEWLWKEFCHLLLVAMDDTSRPPEFPWLNWTPDKKRLWLKQRKVKGTWARNLDSKCAEVWAISSSDAMVDKEGECDMKHNLSNLF